MLAKQELTILNFPKNSWDGYHSQSWVVYDIVLTPITNYTYKTY